MAATDLLAADERFHAPGAEEQWSDSLYFGGGDAASGLAFYTRIGARPNEGRIEAALGVWLPPRMPGHPPRFRPNGEPLTVPPDPLGSDQ